MKSSRATERITIEYASTLDWFLRILVLLSISAILLVVGNRLFGILRDTTNLDLVGIFAVAVLGVWYGFFDGNLKWLIGSDTTKVDIDFESGYVDLTYSSILGSSAERYQFHQILKFKSYRPKRLLRVEYYLQIILVNHKDLLLRIPIGRDKQDAIRFIKRVNKLMASARV